MKFNIALLLVTIFCATAIGGDSTISRLKRTPGGSKGRMSQRPSQPYGQVMAPMHSAPKPPMQSQQSYGTQLARPTMHGGSQQHHMSAPKPKTPSQGSYGSMANMMSQPKPPSQMSSYGGSPKKPAAPSQSMQSGGSSYSSG